MCMSVPYKRRKINLKYCNFKVSLFLCTFIIHVSEVQDLKDIKLFIRTQGDEILALSHFGLDQKCDIFISSHKLSVFHFSGDPLDFSTEGLPGVPKPRVKILQL